MTILTAAITQFGGEPTAVPELIAEPRNAVRITFGPGQAVWIISHDDLADKLPLGATILDATFTDETLPAINKNAGFDSGSSTTTRPLARAQK